MHLLSAKSIKHYDLYRKCVSRWMNRNIKYSNEYPYRFLQLRFCGIRTRQSENNVINYQLLLTSLPSIFHFVGVQLLVLLDVGMQGTQIWIEWLKLKQFSWTIVCSWCKRPEIFECWSSITRKLSKICTLTFKHEKLLKMHTNCYFSIEKHRNSLKVKKKGEIKQFSANSVFTIL